MKNAPKSKNLFEACLEQEHARHAQRLKELKAMQTRLAMLDPCLPAIKAAGLELWHGQISDHGDQLHLTSGVFCGRNNGALTKVLLAQGFKEIKRNAYSTWDVVILAKGRLKVNLSIEKPLPPSPQPEAASTPTTSGAVSNA